MNMEGKYFCKFDTELLQWAFFDSQKTESWHSSVVKRVCRSMLCLHGPSGTAQAKSRTPKFQSETFYQLLAKGAGEGHGGWEFEGFLVEQRGQFSCGYPCVRISRQRFNRNRKKPSKPVKLNSSGTELPSVHRGS